MKTVFLVEFYNWSEIEYKEYWVIDDNYRLLLIVWWIGDECFISKEMGRVYN